MAVIGWTVTVDGDANFYIVLGKNLTELFVEPGTICVNSQVEAGYATQDGLEFCRDPLNSDPSGEQRFPAVQNNLHAAKLMSARVLSNALRCLRDGLVRNDYRTSTPALVSTFVDVTMVAR
jgi:hypothetical protein